VGLIQSRDKPELTPDQRCRHAFSASQTFRSAHGVRGCSPGRFGRVRLGRTFEWDPLRDVRLEWGRRDQSDRSADGSGEPVRACHQHRRRGGKVYFESGATIYSTSSDLVGLTAIITNTEAPTGLALDASHGILYETFGSNGVAVINRADPRMGLGNLFIPATNIVAGGGKVFFESGATIYSTSPDLVGLNTVLNNNQAPTGLALVTTASVPEPSSITLVLVGLMCWAGRHAWFLIRQKA
jgi:hypothetical protein